MHDPANTPKPERTHQRRRKTSAVDTNLPLNGFEQWCARYKKPLLIAIMVCCVGIGLKAFTLIMADINGYQAKRMIERWEKQDKITSQADLEHAYANIQRAREWAPQYPEFIADEALILRWHASSPTFIDSIEQADTLFRQALSLHEQELEQRPTWPYAWTAYASLKVVLGEIDDDFSRAMHNAFLYGPWESQVQLEIVQAGLMAWPKADKATKKLIFKTLDTAFQGNKFIKELVQLTKDQHVFAIACMMPNHDAYMTYVQQQCAQATTTFRLKHQS